MTEKLSPNFLNELFRTAFRNKNIFEILQTHLEYHYLPTEEYKEIWRSAKTRYELFNELPSIGGIAEQHKDKVNILEQLNRIREADVISQNALIKDIESYLRDTMFVNLYKEIGESRNQGKKDEAIKKLKEGAEKINTFSLQAQTFSKVFKEFGERYNKRAIDNAMRGHETVKKFITGIDCLDNRWHGGVDYGDTLGILGLSNVGKSPFLKYIGYSNARIGKRVLHIQVEGTEAECEQGYEAMMAASSLVDIETTALPKDIVDQLIKNSQKVQGEVDIVAFEQFGSVTMNDVRGCVIEYLKVHGHLDLLVLDYLDKVEPGNGKRYSPNQEGEKARKQALADLFKNLCMEFTIGGATGTQASNVSELKKNDPKFFLTRDDIAGDKSFVTPFSYFVTMSQTLDEKRDEIMRLYEDKCRKYGYGYLHTICTGYAHSRFYDPKRTKNMFGQ